MKKIILIAAIVVVLIAVAGCGAENPVVEEEAQENISEEEIVAEDEGCEEAEEEHEHSVEHDEEYEHEHSVEIEGSAMKALSVQEVADLWEISSEVLLSKIVAEFDLQGDYTVDTTLEEIRVAEYKFSPAIIKDLAEEEKEQNIN
jgi:ABC-type Zn2+ transport system substrate-binding protein/surface adhesin